MVGIICRPSFFALVCSFKFHVACSGVETVYDSPFLGFKLFKVFLYHSLYLPFIVIIVILGGYVKGLSYRKTTIYNEEVICYAKNKSNTRMQLKYITRFSCQG